MHRPDRVVVSLRAEEESTWLESRELEKIPAEIEGVPIECRRI